MALDQSHEQLNKCIKGEGGAAGFTEELAALRRWMLAGSEDSRLIAEYEKSCFMRMSTFPLNIIKKHLIFSQFLLKM